MGNLPIVSPVKSHDWPSASGRPGAKSHSTDSAVVAGSHRI